MEARNHGDPGDQELATARRYGGDVFQPWAAWSASSRQ